MVALNGNLGAKTNSSVLAAAILFMIGDVVSLAYLFLSDGMPKLPIKVPIPIFFYLGGLFVMFYILSMTWTAPKFGVGIVLLGQLVSMAIIDHYGLLGALKNTITMQRFVGLVFMMLGVYLTVRRF